MNERRFECEVLTPMFLHSWDNKTPELRTASLKGLLRYWWRALNYSITGLSELKTEESKRFGGSNQEFGRSRLVLKADLESNFYENYNFHPLLHKKKFSFEAIRPGKHFIITIGTNGNTVYDDISYYDNLFKLAAILGGLGKRSRRGFGSFRIYRVDGRDVDNCNSIEKVISLINTIVPDNFNLERSSIIKVAKNYSPDYPYIKEIQIGRTYNSFEELLKRIGEASHIYKHDCLGKANGGRFASPVYVSVIKTSKKDYRPIITTLKTALKNKSKIDLGNQKKFKDEIL